MGILNPLNNVLENLLVLGVLFFVFFWIYKNMEDNKFRRWLGDFFQSMKDEIKGDKNG